MDGKLSLEDVSATSRCPTARSRCSTCRGFQQLDPGAKKVLLGDGNYGGVYQRPDDEMQAIWDIAIAETRALIEGRLGMTAGRLRRC